jgi:ribonucleoside-diphosphate reductase alpha chain
LANNVSSALEPVFAYKAKRKIRLDSGAGEIHELTDFAVRLWKTLKGDQPLPSQFIEAQLLPPSAHLKMQAALQPYVDNSISKTINVPQAFGFEDFRALYEQAYSLGLNGCNTFRPNPTTGAVLEADADRLPHCCAADREAD